jgi:hypothetical protein
LAFIRSPDAVREESAYQDAPPQPVPAAWLGVTDVRVAPKAKVAASKADAHFVFIKQTTPSFEI